MLTVDGARPLAVSRPLAAIPPSRRPLAHGYQAILDLLSHSRPKPDQTHKLYSRYGMFTFAFVERYRAYWER